MYLKIIAVDDFPETGRHIHSLGEKEILILEVEGEFYAMDNMCTHEEWSLENGNVFDGEIECELHGARFCIKTGAAKCFPATDSLNTYNVTVADGEIYIEVD